MGLYIREGNINPKMLIIYQSEGEKRLKMKKRMSANFLVNTWKRLGIKKRREAYNNAQREIGLPFQIWAIRERRGWTQAELAQKCGWSKSRQNNIEGGADALTWKTLERLAAVFDVGLLVKFVPFSELVSEEKEFNATTFDAVGFEEDEIKNRIVHSVGYCASSSSMELLKVAESAVPYSVKCPDLEEYQNARRTAYKPGKTSVAEEKIGEFCGSILQSC